MSIFSGHQRQRETIGVYIPSWLLSSNKSTKHFWKSFLSTLRAGGRYTPVFLNIPRLHLSTSSQVISLLTRRNIKAIVCHDSHLYERSKQYSQNVRLLEEQVRFINTGKSQCIGHDKIKTKRLLRTHGLPVLDDVIAYTAEEVLSALEGSAWHVIKPNDQGAGAGVFLVKKEGADVFVYVNGTWNIASVVDEKKRTDGSRIVLQYRTPLRTKKFTYTLVLVEPYFNDDSEGFASIRCTVIGNKVVEAVKRVNKNNVTSNVSSGGKARVVTFSKEQEELAVNTLHTIGADYAGVDLLVCGGISVVGEINIGPFTTYGAYTRVNVGKLFAEHVTVVCNALSKR
jgi:glutathione synthase/RimK-type ligase-like ATP-grasp enzyme